MAFHFYHVVSSFVYIYCFSRLFFDKLLYTYLIHLQTEYPNFHANSATLIFMQTRLYIANPKPCFSIKKKNLNRDKLHRQTTEESYPYLLILLGLQQLNLIISL